MLLIIDIVTTLRTTSDTDTAIHYGADFTEILTPDSYSFLLPFNSLTTKTIAFKEFISSAISTKKPPPKERLSKSTEQTCAVITT